RLGAFRGLLTQDKAARARAARAFVESLERWQFQGVDSLPIAIAALRIDPSSPLAYAHAARMTAKRGEFARTRAFATQGLRLQSQVAPLWALLSDCDDQDGREAEARIELEHALALHPEQIERGYEKLVALDTRAGQFARADSVAARAPESLRPMLHD